jgi:DNA (cytosine-5)-methyltransferase 1
MSAYYNENDPFAVAWLRELIKAGLIADGEVDERSIEYVTADDVRGFTQCHFFAGIGGWSYALRLAGWPDERAVWTGSCPCQPFSSAGAQAGGHDPRDLWPTWYQLIRECRPSVVFGEQVKAAIAHGWLDRLCDDLEGQDYAVGAANLPACSVGTPHLRYRIWFVADADARRLSRAATWDSSSNDEPNLAPSQSIWRSVSRTTRAGMQSPWPAGPGAIEQIPRMADGVSDRVAERNAYGNAIVPQVAQVFIEAYLEAVESLKGGGGWRMRDGLSLSGKATASAPPASLIWNLEYGFSTSSQRMTSA